MNVRKQIVLALAAVALTGIAGAQTTSPGRAASAAVTPGDQNMGRNPNNRTGGMMSSDQPGGNAATAAGNAATATGRAAKAAVTPGDQDMGRNPNNRTGGLMGSDRMATDGTPATSTTTRSRRAPRPDRG